MKTQSREPINHEEVFKALGINLSKVTLSAIKHAEEEEWIEIANYYAEGNVRYGHAYGDIAKGIQIVLSMRSEHFEPIFYSLMTRFAILKEDGMDIRELTQWTINEGCSVGVPLGILKWANQQNRLNQAQMAKIEEALAIFMLVPQKAGFFLRECDKYNQFTKLPENIKANERAKNRLHRELLKYFCPASLNGAERASGVIRVVMDTLDQREHITSLQPVGQYILEQLGNIVFTSKTGMQRSSLLLGREGS